MSDVIAALERIERLLAALRRATAPGSSARRALVARLLATTGLSAAGIERALDGCLEQSPTDRELTLLCGGVARARRAHVILPGSVFVAAHRALALALAASARVFVKPSRRDPALIEAIHAQAPQLFQLVERLAAEPGDHIFAYGSDTTLETLRGDLPPGTVLHAHGSGFGIAIVDLQPPSPASLERAAGPESAGERATASGEAQADDAIAGAIAEDTALFDQRGCLSPRFVLVLAEPARAERFAERLARALAALERELPLGGLDPDERAEITWYLQSAACFARIIPAGSGAIIVRDPAEPVAHAARGVLGTGTAALEIPPTGRHLEVIAISNLDAALDALRPWLTTVGCSSPALEARLSERLHPIRVTALGQMQTPPLDGPVDRRTDPRGEILQ